MSFLHLFLFSTPLTSAYPSPFSTDDLVSICLHCKLKHCEENLHHLYSLIDSCTLTLGLLTGCPGTQIENHSLYLHTSSYLVSPTKEFAPATLFFLSYMVNFSFIISIILKQMYKHEKKYLDPTFSPRCYSQTLLQKILKKLVYICYLLHLSFHYFLSTFQTLVP